MAALFAAGQAVVGFCAGIAVSAGLFAFIATLGIITRLAQVTRTASAIHWYETCFIAGGIMGNLLWLYGVPVPAGAAGLLCTGLFCGIFTGCLTGAIAEILDAFPVFFRRINLKTGTAFVIAAMAVGRFLGVLARYFG